MTMIELRSKIGSAVIVNLEGLRVMVDVKDVREAYGRQDIRITPVNGAGTKWVSIDRIVVE